MKRLLVFAALLLTSCAVNPASMSQRLIQSTVVLATDQDRAYCSGVAITETRILTAAHCDVGIPIKVRVEGGSLASATVLYKDEANDLMVLAVIGEQFRPVIRGDSDTIRRGDTVFVIGAPYGVLEFSFQVGTIGHVNRKLVFGQFFQIYAEARGGNSGGPVFNEAGELIGILTRGDEGGISLAVPINLLPK